MILGLSIMELSSITKTNLAYVYLWIYFGMSIGVSTYTVED